MFHMTPFDNPSGDAPTFTSGLTRSLTPHSNGSSTSYAFTSNLTLDVSYVPPPPSVTGTSMPHMPLSGTYSSDSEEYSDEPADEVTPAHRLGIGHRVKNKKTRFTPSDYP
ncbi:hypothetical protein M9H77_04429 [Catharanthus roseus]|uniref:Uncharacterized protein n=1 Tax=Catharanthus roseus TaxID=4058 RepID=A0ACC0CEJ9_CATRO|nr:hypothetical protein M9H77_04429 [Catharanthus roseus]